MGKMEISLLITKPEAFGPAELNALRKDAEALMHFTEGRAHALHGRLLIETIDALQKLNKSTTRLNWLMIVLTAVILGLTFVGVAPTIMR